ncbi:MAG: hypothetical protein LBN98_01055 [Prevotellaceae bacterium]|nr:hypothetical protein [Prevotellaceae bacterium]
MRTKIFFLFAMLASITANAQVTNIEPVGANYANKTVSFRVWWNAGSWDAMHLSKVWVWADYITVNSNNTTSDNTWERATVGTVSGGVTSYNGTTTQTVSGKTLAASALTITPTTIKDKTECPGVFCIYSGSDLYIDTTHLCQQRASGAQNWEAWIKDTRDTELYRIFLMPDNKWWLAQNVKYADVGAAISGCTKDA